MRTFCNGTADVVEVTFCTSAEHHADNAHPDPDPDLATVHVPPAALLTFDTAEDNAAAILDQMTDFTEKT